LQKAFSPEFVAEELRAALDAVGDVVGRADADDVLGKILRQILYRQIAIGAACERRVVAAIRDRRL
jgi:hypothetical protein